MSPDLAQLVCTTRQVLCTAGPPVSVPFPCVPIRKNPFLHLDEPNGFFHTRPHRNNTSDNPDPCYYTGTLGLGDRGWDWFDSLNGGSLGWSWVSLGWKKSPRMYELSMLPGGQTGSGFLSPSSTWKCLLSDRCRIQPGPTAYTFSLDPRLERRARYPSRCMDTATSQVNSLWLGDHTLTAVEVVRRAWQTRDGRI